MSDSNSDPSTEGGTEKSCTDEAHKVQLEIYKAYNEHWKHSQTVRWTIFGSSTAFQAIVISGIVTIHSKNTEANAILDSLTILMPTLGGISAFFAIMLLKRASRFCDAYETHGRSVEEFLSSPDQKGSEYDEVSLSFVATGPFNTAARLRKAIANHENDDTVRESQTPFNTSNIIQLATTSFLAVHLVTLLATLSDNLKHCSNGLGGISMFSLQAVLIATMLKVIAEYYG